MWYELEDIKLFQSIHTANCPFFYSSMSSNHPGPKSGVQQGIESILSHEQQRRPLPSTLYKSFFYGFGWQILRHRISFVLITHAVVHCTGLLCVAGAGSPGALRLDTAGTFLQVLTSVKKALVCRRMEQIDLSVVSIVSWNLTSFLTSTEQPLGLSYLFWQRHFCEICFAKLQSRGNFNVSQKKYQK